MPVYLYECPSCNTQQDVVKTMSEIDRTEVCKCGQSLDSSARKINFLGSFLYEKVEDAEYNQGLGCVTYGRKHRAEIAKRKGLVEIGNDESPDQSYRRFEAQREQASNKRWNDLQREFDHV